MQRGKEKENCILLWKFFGLYSVVHLVFNKMCQAQLESGRFSRLRLKSELSSLNCSYCHSAPGQIPRFPDYQSQQYQELSNLGERTAHPSAHTLAQHLTTFEKSYEYYNKVCRRNVAWGSPFFMTPMCLCVCCVEIVIFLIYFNLWDFYMRTFVASVFMQPVGQSILPSKYVFFNQIYL